MRVLVSHLTPFPSSRAAAIQVANMAQAFAEHGNDVLLVSPTPGPDSEADVETLLGFAAAFRATTLSPRQRRGQSFVHAVRVARLVQREQIDLLFTRNLRAAVLPARRGTPTVLEVHALSSLTGALDLRAFRSLTRAPGFRGIVAISEALALDIVRAFALDPDRVLVAHDGVRADPVPDPPMEERTAGQEPSPARVAYTGSLHPGKGADLVLDIAHRLPLVAFLVAGGPKARADELRGAADARGLRNVHITGPVSPAEARRIQGASDVLVAPFGRRVESDSGVDIARWTSPLKIFEYMASGRPMVVGDLPVLREVLRPDVDALVVPLDDVDAFADAIRRLIGDPELATRLAEAAGERARASYTWGVRAQSILDRFGTRPRIETVTIVLASFASGGAERVGINLANGIAATGRAVRLLAIDGRGPLRAAVGTMVTVESLDRRRVRWAIPILLRLIRRDLPDVLVTTQTHVSLPLLAALRLPRLRRRQRPHLVVREPLLRPSLPGTTRLERGQRLLLPSADLLIGSSPAMTDELRRLTGPAGPRVLELANPVDVAELRAAAAAGAATLPASSRGASTIVVVARLVTQKGHADLLQAFAAASETPLELNIVGDGPLRGELERLARRLEIAPRVHFLGQLDDRDRLLATVAAADLLVQPSTMEGMPNAVLEALALGTPVLATTDLTVLTPLAEEVGPVALRLVPRNRLAAALGEITPLASPPPRRSLLPARFNITTVVAELLAALGDTNGPPDA